MSDYNWAQICIVHDKGFAIIGNRYQFTSTSKNVPNLKKGVPVVDLTGIPAPAWQAILREYITQGYVADLNYLVEDLENLKTNCADCYAKEVLKKSSDYN